ncbi:MAG TPA: type II toxin-antitoxin system VapC family toxin [Myxococcota bacterium]|nr:type II toxin-antitoxin system VapC family toxin [Myxococcota bacterium]
MIVVDASAVVELLIGGPAASAVAARIGAGDEALHAPHLLDLEVAQVLRRFALAGALDDRRGHEALEDLADLDLARHPHDLFLRRIWSLRQRVTAYDAVYLALAEALPAPLVTLDRRLARAGGHRARIELLG